MKTINVNAYYLLVSFIFLLLSPVTSGAQEKKCRPTTFELDSMQQKNILLYQSDTAIEYELNVKIAKNNAQRQAGFQHLCEKAIREQALLFLFKLPIIPKFHMHNVHASLDIAFIDASGEIINIQAMHPYNFRTLNKPLYGVNNDVQAVLEAHQGFFKKQGITIGWKLKDLPKLLNEGAK